MKAAAVLAALGLAAAAAGAVEVWIDRPAPGEVGYGEVEVQLHVEADEPVQVDLLLDGRPLGTLAKPPWRFKLDLGYENVEHKIEVIARGRSGATARAAVTTGTVHVDDELDVELQQLYVTVTRGDERLLDLSADDFRISDDGARQTIVTFERGDVPLTTVLLLDVSASMAGPRLESAVAGARVFLDGMSELDEAAVMLFSDRLLRSTPFTHDTAELAEALAGIEPTGGTSLNDALLLGLQRLEGRQGRRVVVLFSDGADVHSVLPMAEVLERARTSRALIYWVHLGDGDGEEPDFTSSWRASEGTVQEFRLLHEAVKASGGTVRIVDTAEELAPAFAAILSELREQYVLGYYPTEARNDGSWHAVKVAVKASGARVRSRAGYFDY